MKTLPQGSALPDPMSRIGFIAFCSLTLVGFSASAAHAAAIVVDDFSEPSPGKAYAIDLADPDPFLIKTVGPGILGGERDLLVDVAGASGPLSATGVVGDDTYLFGSAGAGASATLQYDGVDSDIVGPPAQLVNAEGLGGVDLIAATNTGFLFAFLSVDGGAATVLGLDMAATSTTGSASFSGSIPESTGPSGFFVPFASFGTVGSFSFADLTSLEVTFNPTAVHDVDFELDAIRTVPEPLSVMFLLLGSITVAKRTR